MVARRSIRTLVVVAAACAVTLLAGCSLIPGIGTPEPAPPAPPSKAAKPDSAKATAQPASGKSLSSIPATGLPLPNAKVKPARPDIDGIQARDMMASGVKLVDVRDKAPFRAERIKGAVNVPMWRFTKDAAEWDRGKAVIICDQTGPQARTAVTWLQQHGFTKAYYLVGGVDEWDAKLVGTDARDVPAQKPVLYYFYLEDDYVEHVLGLLGRDFSQMHATQDELKVFLNDLDEEFGGQYEFHKYNVGTEEGYDHFAKFTNGVLPMLVLVKEDGEEYKTGKEINAVKLRADLQRAAKAYEGADGQ